jgi:hypothetical protein
MTQAINTAVTAPIAIPAVAAAAAVVEVVLFRAYKKVYFCCDPDEVLTGR